MFETIKPSIKFTKEEILIWIANMAKEYYISLDLKSNGTFSIWIGDEKRAGRTERS